MRAVAASGIRWTLSTLMTGLGTGQKASTRPFTEPDITVSNIDSKRMIW